MILLHHFLIFFHKNAPITMEIIGALQINLVAPFVPLREQKIDQGGLVVSFELGPADERPTEKFPGLDPGFTLGSHGRPCVQNVERPLTVAQQEAASVEADPVLTIVHQFLPPVHNEIVVPVALYGELEGHVGEHGVAVHPPNELHLRV
eukprot:Gb_35520 [translate_table: standard]